MLPEIAPLLFQARDLKQKHDEAQAAIAGVQGTVKTNGHGLDIDLNRHSQGAQQTAIAINAIVTRVKRLGVEVKDLEMGLVDFRAEMDGRDVYLCWKLGEERVSYWHEIDAGYASRQPLD